MVQWCPPAGGSRVLITSRQANWDPGLGLRQLPLGLFERPESIDLLRKFRPDLGVDDPDLNATATELGDLPLALHMAGKFLQTYRHVITPGQYLGSLRRPGLLKHRSSSEVEFSPTGHDLDVGRTFRTSLERLDKEKEVDRLALNLLAKIACFASGELIGQELLKASAGEDLDVTAFREGMNRLLGSGLVEENEAGALRMHRLVACYVRDTIPEENTLAEVEKAVNNAASEANKSGNPDHMQPILVHLKQLTDQAIKRGDEQAARLASNLGYYLDTIADYAGARSYYEQALAINKKVLGEQHPDTAGSLNNLGALLDSIGDYAGALPYHEQALAIKKKVLGEEHPDTARSLNNLGNVLQSLGDYADARPYYEQALAINKKVLGEQHPDTAGSLNNLGSLLQAQGDYAGARPYYEQALAIRREALGEQHPDTARSLNNLGDLLQAQGDYAGARPYYEQALAIRRKVLGDQHPDTARSLNNLGSLLQALGDYAGARPYYEQALAINKKVLGEQHPDTASSLNNLGSLLLSLGDYAGARLYLEQALAIADRVLGKNHPTSRIIQENLGTLNKEMERKGN